MLSAVFQKHQSSNFISTAQLEAEMKAQLASMQQTVEKMRVPVAAPMTTNQSFAAVSPEVRKAERTMNFADSIISDMTGIDFNGLGDGALGSLFSLASDICDAISPDAVDVMEEITTKGNLNATIDAAVEARDQAMANPRVQQMARAAFEKDAQRFAQQQKIQLGSADSIQGLQNRMNIMQQRLDKVTEARMNGVQHVELDGNGINLPEIRNELGWKNASVGYTAMRAKQSMHGGMRLTA